MQVGAVERVDAPQTAQIERCRHPEDAVGTDFELGGQQVGQVLAHVGLDLEAERLAEATAAQLHLDGDQQVVGLVLFEREVGVAGHPERVVVTDHHAGEERVEVGGDHLLEGHETLTVGHHHEARQGGRDLHPGDTPLPRGGVLHLDHQVERQVRDVGERVSRVDRQRREDRIDLALEDVDQVLAVVIIERGPVGETDALPVPGRAR